jgi:hypothetical protein
MFFFTFQSNIIIDMLNCLKTNLEHHNIVCVSILEEQGTIRRLKCHPLSHFKEN